MYLDPFYVPDRIEAPDFFQGLDRSREVETYQRSLPHFRQPGATYFLTFRLADAIPVEVAEELEAQAEIWRRRLDLIREQHGGKLPENVRDEYEAHQRLLAVRTEHLLDAGGGACWMANPALRGIVQEALHHFDGVRMELLAFTVMPNHVHILFCPATGFEPEALAASWKRFTAVTINRINGFDGQFWQAESWDRIVRDQDHLRRVTRYIARNPMQAHLTPRQASVWISPRLIKTPSSGWVSETGPQYHLDPW